jgi:hypothetical protein
LSQACDICDRSLEVIVKEGLKIFITATKFDAQQQQQLANEFRI